LKRRHIAAASLVAIAAAIVVVAWATRDTTILRLRGRGDTSSRRDIVYRPGSTNPKHRLDVYSPRNAGGAPVVHFVHGGYWVGGDKDYHRTITGLYGSVGEALAAEGILTVIQSYRLVPEATIEEVIDDVMAGLKWTEEHAEELGGDPARLFMMGHSAGGHLTALVGSDDTLHARRGMNPDAVLGYIPISAVWDISDMDRTQDDAFRARVTDRVFGRDRARWSQYSPMERLRPGLRPFMIVIGEKDYVYLIPQAERARQKLISFGATPAFYVAGGNDHDSMVLRFGAAGDNMTSAIVAFVKSVRPLRP
jgi:acetyl esterase/lipase